MRTGGSVMDSELAKYILEEVNKKNKKIDDDNKNKAKVNKKKNITAEEWLEDIASNAAKCKFATHVGRFVNPDVSNVVINVKDITSASNETEGYITTTGTDCQMDMSVASAAYLGTAKLLMLPLADGKTVYQHLIDDENFLQKELPNLNIDYKKTTEELLKVMTDVLPIATDERLRQVYFPIDICKDKYHLLTVLSPSSIMIELSKRIKKMEDLEFKIRHNKIFDESYTKIYNLTEVGFGGTKAQNISCGNSSVGGKCYLLNSMPPELAKRDIAIPKKNFFKDTLNVRSFYNLFKSLHDVYKETNNNLNSRTHARNIEIAIINKVIVFVYKLRKVTRGWSDDNSALSISQKIWLDDKYSERRASESDWTEDIVVDFTDWIMNTYEFVMKKEKIILGDGEYLALKHVIKDAVLAYTTTEGGMSE